MSSHGRSTHGPVRVLRGCRREPSPHVAHNDPNCRATSQETIPRFFAPPSGFRTSLEPQRPMLGCSGRRPSSDARTEGTGRGREGESGTADSCVRTPTSEIRRVASGRTSSSDRTGRGASRARVARSGAAPPLSKGGQVRTFAYRWSRKSLLLLLVSRRGIEPRTLCLTDVTPCVRSNGFQQRVGTDDVWSPVSIDHLNPVLEASALFRHGRGGKTGRSAGKCRRRARS
jgi:hypothetical protein